MDIISILTLLGFFVFCFLILLKSRQLRKKGISVSMNRQSVKNTISIVLVIVFFLTFLSELLFQSLQLSFSILPNFLKLSWNRPKAIEWLGVLFVILSVLYMYFALSAFNSSLRFGLNANNLGKLITCGIFAHSRNPFFSSILMLFIGITLVYPCLYFAIVTVLSFFSIHVFILKEEKFMRENYGEEYQNYCNKVRRYF